MGTSTSLGIPGGAGQHPKGHIGVLVGGARSPGEVALAKDGASGPFCCSG